jgi:hypothetical protein
MGNETFIPTADEEPHARNFRYQSDPVSLDDDSDFENEGGKQSHHRHADDHHRQRRTSLIGSLKGIVDTVALEEPSKFIDPVLSAAAAGAAVRKAKQQRYQRKQQHPLPHSKPYERNQQRIAFNNEWKKSLQRLAKTAASTATSVANVTAPIFVDAGSIVVESAKVFASDVEEEWKKENAAAKEKDDQSLILLKTPGIDSLGRVSVDLNIESPPSWLQKQPQRNSPNERSSQISQLSDLKKKVHPNTDMHDLSEMTTEEPVEEIQKVLSEDDKDPSAMNQSGVNRDLAEGMADAMKKSNSEEKGEMHISDERCVQLLYSDNQLGDEEEDSEASVEQDVMEPPDLKVQETNDSDSDIEDEVEKYEEVIESKKFHFSVAGTNSQRELELEEEDKLSPRASKSDVLTEFELDLADLQKEFAEMIEDGKIDEFTGDHTKRNALLKSCDSKKVENESLSIFVKKGEQSERRTANSEMKHVRAGIKKADSSDVVREFKDDLADLKNTFAEMMEDGADDELEEIGFESYAGIQSSEDDISIDSSINLVLKKDEATTEVTMVTEGRGKVKDIESSTKETNISYDLRDLEKTLAEMTKEFSELKEDSRVNNVLGADTIPDFDLSSPTVKNKMDRQEIMGENNSILVEEAADTTKVLDQIQTVVDVSSTESKNVDGWRFWALSNTSQVPTTETQESSIFLEMCKIQNAKRNEGARTTPFVESSIWEEGWIHWAKLENVPTVIQPSQGLEALVSSETADSGRHFGEKLSEACAHESEEDKVADEEQISIEKRTNEEQNGKPVISKVMKVEECVEQGTTSMSQRMTADSNILSDSDDPPSQMQKDVSMIYSIAPVVHSKNKRIKTRYMPGNLIKAQAAKDSLSEAWQFWALPTTNPNLNTTDATNLSSTFENMQKIQNLRGNKLLKPSDVNGWLFWSNFGNETTFSESFQPSPRGILDIEIHEKEELSESLGDDSDASKLKNEATGDVDEAGSLSEAGNTEVRQKYVERKDAIFDPKDVSVGTEKEKGVKLNPVNNGIDGWRFWVIPSSNPRPNLPVKAQGHSTFQDMEAIQNTRGHMNGVNPSSCVPPNGGSGWRFWTDLEDKSRQVDKFVPSSRGSVDTERRSTEIPVKEGDFNVVLLAKESEEEAEGQIAQLRMATRMITRSQNKGQKINNTAPSIENSRLAGELNTSYNPVLSKSQDEATDVMNKSDVRSSTDRPGLVRTEPESISSLRDGLQGSSLSDDPTNYGVLIDQEEGPGPKGTEEGKEYAVNDPGTKKWLFWAIPSKRLITNTRIEKFRSSTFEDMQAIQKSRGNNLGHSSFVQPSDKNRWLFWCNLDNRSHVSVKDGWLFWAIPSGSATSKTFKTRHRSSVFEDMQIIQSSRGNKPKQSPLVQPSDDNGWLFWSNLDNSKASLESIQSSTGKRFDTKIHDKVESSRILECTENMVENEITTHDDRESYFSIDNKQDPEVHEIAHADMKQVAETKQRAESAKQWLFAANADSIYEGGDTLPRASGQSAKKDLNFDAVLLFNHPGAGKYAKSLLEKPKKMFNSIFLKLLAELDTQQKSHDEWDSVDLGVHKPNKVVYESVFAYEKEEVVSSSVLSDSLSFPDSVPSMTYSSNGNETESQHASSSWDLIPLKTEIRTMETTFETGTAPKTSRDVFWSGKQLLYGSRKDRKPTSASNSLTESVDSLGTAGSSFKSDPIVRKRRISRRSNRLASKLQSGMQRRLDLKSKEGKLPSGSTKTESVTVQASPFSSVSEEMTETGERLGIDVALFDFSSLENVDFLKKIPRKDGPSASLRQASTIWYQLLANWKHTVIWKAITARACSPHFEAVSGDAIFVKDTDSVSSSTIKFQFYNRRIQFSEKFSDLDSFLMIKNLSGFKQHSLDGRIMILTDFLCDIGPKLYGNEDVEKDDSLILRHILCTAKSNEKEESIDITGLLKHIKGHVDSFSRVVRRIVEFSSQNDSMREISFDVGLKNYSSIREKAERKYGDDILQVKDVLRGQITFPDESSLVCGLYYLHKICKGESESSKASSELEIIRLKNLFRTSQGIEACHAPLPTGYRHVLINIRIGGTIIAGTYD